MVSNIFKDITAVGKSGTMRSSGPHLLPEQWEASIGRVPSLDGLRCFSILVVLVGHFVLPVKLIGVSAFGVKVFFFISGFLISRLLYAEYKRNLKIDLPGFYTRRILRLYPVILAYLAIVSCIIYIRSGSYSINEIGSVFLYYVNYLEVYYAMHGLQLIYPIGVLWSLSVEEHFYLVAPFAFVFLQSKPKKMLLVCVAICLLCLSIRLFYAHLWPNLLETNYIYKHSETRFDSIAFGVMLSSLLELDWGRALIRKLCTKSAFIIGCVGMILTFAVRDPYIQNTFRFTFQGLLLMPIVCGLVLSAPFPILNRIANLKPLVWVGTLSYSLYVWHGGVQFFFDGFLAMQPPQIVGYWEVVLAFLLAMLSYYLIEKPILVWRDRLKRRKILTD